LSWSGSVLLIYASACSPWNSHRPGELIMLKLSIFIHHRPPAGWQPSCATDSRHHSLHIPHWLCIQGIIMMVLPCIKTWPTLCLGQVTSLRLWYQH
jgi:hypothetical protein